MKTLKEEARFNCSAHELWVILSDVGRCDWVPTIDKIALEALFAWLLDDVRSAQEF